MKLFLTSIVAGLISVWFVMLCLFVKLIQDLWNEDSKILAIGMVLMGISATLLISSAIVVIIGGII